MLPFAEASTFTPLLSSMKPIVFTSIHELKVLYPIVSFIIVYMMNMFVSRKLTPKMLLHYESMFKDSSLGGYPNIYISIFSLSLATFPHRMLITYTVTMTSNLTAFLESATIGAKLLANTIAAYRAELSPTSWSTKLTPALATSFDHKRSISHVYA